MRWRWVYIAFLEFFYPHGMIHQLFYIPVPEFGTQVNYLPATMAGVTRQENPNLEVLIWN
jgi:hypothetical protein